MNPLTQVKNTQKITAREAAAGISEQGSWHEKYKDSAYINVGLLPFGLTEGDLLALFAQYGEVVDVNLVRDKATGKSRGFAFLAYEDQRSTVLAVDNLNGAQVDGRTIRVDHVANYKKKVEEDEVEEKKKREERSVCYAFQRGECNRGDACKFSHDLQRNANTGWGKKDDAPTWRQDKNGRSPPPPPWKQGNRLKDNPPNPPPWRRSSGQKDDPPPSRDRKENGSNFILQARDESRQKGSVLQRRYEERTRDEGPPSSSRQRPSQMDDNHDRVQDGSQRRGDDRGAPRNGNRRDSSPRQKSDKYSRDGDSSLKRRHRSRSPSPKSRHRSRSPSPKSRHRSRSPGVDQRSSGTRSRRDLD